MKSNSQLIKSLGLIFTLLTASVGVKAQKVNSFTDPNSQEFWMLLAVSLFSLAIIVVLIMLIFLLSTLRQVLYKQMGMPEEARETFWQRFNKRFVSGDLLPVEREKEIMLDHAYDGIHELDNFMPPWLKYFFIGTIGFAVVYLLHYMVLDTGKLQMEEYEQELYEAKVEADARLALAKNNINEENAVMISDAAALEGAKAFYLANCAACHAQDGGGGVGPNLTDEYWIHGGTVGDVFKTIKYGVKEKGMIPWQDKMTPEQMQNMASYILLMQGTTPASPKDPQGEKMQSAPQVADSTATASL
ncbi:cbb3-type cytochrome c oxidase N-terminal domain-containing protein [Cytophagales bacterium LB-30]|uniref:Cbb3-type cytochrome c oxidase N-terminal domain-containing protein n=1 Tax=Shiella aurantiaca TaxID=3058365 RepID=A0ABT8F297_9BACT|nr:cbb3-type cytochrome c oxidase N-terminal domain-containing protein [Shiella aurantiaca]MDN4164578.1 cbb3-type cytochrome c oxidase N-terminal domain-containing protein [Shiella aurantiaca]